MKEPLTSTGGTTGRSDGPLAGQPWFLLAILQDYASLPVTTDNSNAYSFGGAGR
jgi:hypothetical protein